VEILLVNLFYTSDSLPAEETLSAVSTKFEELIANGLEITQGYQ